MTRPATVYRLELTPVPNWRTDPVIRLRMALKALLRQHGLRCVAVEEVHHNERTGDESKLVQGDANE